MGREIRRVPAGWEHPRDAQGHYKPIHDQPYKEALAEWKQGQLLWKSGKHPDQEKGWGTGSTWEEWDGGAPDPAYYRPAFDGEATHYQIYETVTEGTPTSPVFESLDELRRWLIARGYSEHAATKFCKNGWAPSMIFVPGQGVSGIGIHSLDWEMEEAE